LSWPAHSSFTPYDIFHQDRSAPYSKRRYYELVKVYHPDNQHNDHPILKNVSDEVRLRRYRLIVTAHEILSDPAKRAAYDTDGSGWHSHPDHPNPRVYPQTYKKPADYDSSVFHNATWEDWERYYNRHQPKQVQTVSHRTFVTFIVLIVAFGGLAKASWISQNQTSLARRIQEVNIKSARLLAGRRQQTDNLQSADKRVQQFLIQRDPTKSGLKEEEEIVYKEALAPDRLRLPAPQSYDVPGKR
jgi:curved DNA-binding protein CbpA